MCCKAPSIAWDETTAFAATGGPQEYLAINRGRDLAFYGGLHQSIMLEKSTQVDEITRR